MSELALGARAGVRRVAQRLGLEVRRYHPEHSPEARRRALLAHLGIDLVLDVGANAGQYARELRLAGYRGRIVSFEPLEEPFARLARRAARDAKWDARRLALGEEDGEAEMVVTRDTMSSSLLEPSAAHAEAVTEVGRQRVPVARLDTAVGREAEGARAMLKLDVQGSEAAVLRGGERTLERVQAIEAELSLVPLYRDAPLLRAMLDELEALGFACVGLEPAYVDPTSGRVLQVDGAFVRDGAA